MLATKTREEGNLTRASENGVMQRQPKSAGSYQSQGTNSLLYNLRGSMFPSTQRLWLGDTGFGFLASRTVRENFSCFKAPSLCNLLKQPQKKTN